MKILVVEDDPIFQIAISGALRALNHEVVTAADGVAALVILHRENIRLVVSDWKMPMLDGLDLCRAIRAKGTDYVYFILLTVAEATDENHDVALTAGVDDFLTKPLAKRELKSRIHVAQRIIQFTTQVRQLESFLPICSHCRRVRDDQNYWQQIEAYVNERTGTRFSHGVCPECYETHTIPELLKLGIEPPALKSPTGPRVTASGSRPPLPSGGAPAGPPSPLP
jgi:sigma-B regulation protein RsbU (phosphoserine phosphatase)